jgi:hypothetical protein
MLVNYLVHQARLLFVVLASSLFETNLGVIEKQESVFETNLESSESKSLCLKLT